MAQLKPQESRSAVEIAVDYMILHVENRMDADAEAGLMEWFQQDPSHQRLFQNAIISWWDLENQGLQPEIAELRAEALQAYGEASQRRWQRYAPQSRWPKVAGFVLVAVLLAALSLWRTRS